MVALLVAFGGFFALYKTTPQAQAILGLDTSDILSVPIKSYTDAAQKIAHTGISTFGIPVPFTSLDSIMKLAVQRIIKNMQLEVVMWVNNKNPVTGNSLNPGVNNGNPLYEQNLPTYMNQVRQQTASQYIGQLKSQDTLCNYYKDSVINNLERDFQVSDSNANGNVPNDFNYISDFNNPNNTCTIESLGGGQDNVKSFLAGDFIGGGGWDTWTLLTQNDNNNIYGAYLTQQDKMQNAINNKQQSELQELNWNQGFHSEKDTAGNVTTPGIIIKDQLSFVLSSDLRQLENAKTFDDYVTVLANTFISKAISSGGGLLNTDLSSQFQQGGGGDYGNTSGEFLNPEYDQILNNASSSMPRSNRQPQNLAPRGTAQQSSTPYGGDFPHDASVALTGSRNRNADYGGVSITGEQDNPWWEVDLGQSVPVTKVVVTPPNDDDYLLTNYYVYISKVDMPNHDIPDVSANTWRSELITTDYRGHIASIVPPDGTIGRYVRVQLIGHSQLKIAGVEVYAENAPVITLRGANPMTVSVGDDFVDPGAVATDQNDGQITDIQVRGTVNTNVKGRYTLTYSVRNSQGISADPVTRTVIVK